MRPQILFPLFRSVLSLKGVGDAVAGSLSKLLRHESSGQHNTVTIPYVRDLLFHAPSGFTDRRHLYKLADAPNDEIASLCIVVDKHYPAARVRGRKLPYKIACHDDSGDMVLVFFNGREDYLRKQLPEGAPRIISGKLELFDGVHQMTHPDVIAKPEQRDNVLRLETNYPLSQGVMVRKLRSLIYEAISDTPELPEWLSAAVIEKRNWHGWRESILRLHYPKEPQDIAPESPFRQRLAYDEVLANQLSLAIVRQKAVKQLGIKINGESHLQQQLLKELPFELTDGQQRVLSEIHDDYASGNRMLRLLQGDVGSGKTVVALLAMMPLIERGYQAALMVPTEILGRQHMEGIKQLITPLGLKAAVISGKLPAAERKIIQEQVETGEINIIIGTHALFQSSLSFHQLGLVVIDEQHRFGVKQRLALADKGIKPHTLLMTATPIPRSLTMTAYGDMDSSILAQKPAGREPIDTLAVPLSRIEDVVEGLKRSISKGQKAYWICPLVEESEETFRPEGDLAAAEERYHVFKNIFGDRVALAHGRMKPEERAEAMDGFAGDKYDLLIATTVVEVGVNVPEATIMVIEHAERFGLAQLHQLRGRVGRGEDKSNCILLYAPKLSAIAKQRLGIIRETNDGFRISEEDLVLRGAGDVLGTRQSGLPHFYFADLVEHRELMLMARDDVKMILNDDAALESERGKALRVLLYLFGYDESLKFIRAG